jgi:hypothetical protein
MRGKLYFAESLTCDSAVPHATSAITNMSRVFFIVYSLFDG